MWTGPPQHAGVATSRGVIYHLGRGRQVFVGHAAVYLADGAWPDGQVLHTCDVPQCVRREHLYIGTPADNVRDRVTRGRGRAPDKRGERHHMSRLTDRDIVEIRDLAHCGLFTQAAIAAMYGITQPPVSRIKAGKRWGHV